MKHRRKIYFNINIIVQQMATCWQQKQEETRKNDSKWLVFREKR